MSRFTKTNARRRHARALTITTTLAVLTIGSRPADAADTPPPNPLGPAAETPRNSVGPQKLGVFLGSGYLASPGAGGAAFTAGLRLGVTRNVALSFDLGYGMLSAPGAVQDRWWLMPAAALVIPAGRARFDLGAGFGAGTASGYPTWSSFASAPFMPAGAFQLFPAVRVHAMAALALRRNLDVFARVDAASLLVDSKTFGFRTGSFGSGATDTTWLNLVVGVQLRLL